MNTTICAAIAKREVLQFHYTGGLRTVEPYRHGRSTAGNEVLRGYQVSGYSSSRKSSGWKLFQVDKMAQLQQTSERFPVNRSGYQPKDKTMRAVHCQVERFIRVCGAPLVPADKRPTEEPRQGVIGLLPWLRA